MVNKFYKEVYKSRKTVSKKEARKLRNEIKELKGQIDKRSKQIEKFEKLIVSDPDHKERYQQRIAVHKDFIIDHTGKIKENEIILLDS